MTQIDIQRLKYPIGTFIPPASHPAIERERWTRTIEAFPTEISSLTLALGQKDLALTYRPDGWNVRQLVHHCADSHMNALIRFKLAMTEENPTIKPYEEAKWAEQADYSSVSVKPSLGIIAGVHHRWTILLRSMSSTQYERTYIHPAHGRVFSLGQALANYDWHCRHHLQHIKIALDK